MLGSPLLLVTANPVNPTPDDACRCSAFYMFPWCLRTLQQGEDAGLHTGPGSRRTKICSLFTACNSCTAKLNTPATNSTLIEVWCNRCSHPRFADMNCFWKANSNKARNYDSSYLQCSHCKKRIRKWWRIQNSDTSTVKCWFRQHAVPGISAKQLQMLYNGSNDNWDGAAPQTMMIQIWCDHCSNPRLLRLHSLRSRTQDGKRKRYEWRCSHCRKERTTWWRIHN